MDDVVDSLNNAYQEFVTATTGCLRDAQETPVSKAALEEFKHKWDLFKVACDQAEDVVESVKMRLRSECRKTAGAIGSISGESRLGAVATGPLTGGRIAKTSSSG